MTETPTPEPTPTPTPSPSPTPPTPPSAGPAPKADEPFFTGFADDELRGHPSVIKHKSVEDLARSLVYAEKRLGVPADQLLRVPTKPDDKAAHLEIYRKLGAPEKPEDYGIQFEDDAGDEVKAIGQKLATYGAENGLNKDQMAGLIGMLNAETKATAEAEAAAAAAETEACEAALKKEWGAAYPQMRKDIASAIVKVAEGAGVEVKALMADLDAKGLGSSVALNKVFAHFATLTAEPGSAPNGRTTEGVMTPAEAKNARLAMEGDKDKLAILQNKSHPQHDALVKERMKYIAFENAKAE